MWSGMGRWAAAPKTLSNRTVEGTGHWGQGSCIFSRASSKVPSFYRNGCVLISPELPDLVFLEPPLIEAS